MNASRVGVNAPRRVFVAGIGCLSALGETWGETHRALMTGACAIAPVTRFDITGFPCTVGAPIDRFAFTLDRRTEMARIAGDEAWAMSGLHVGEGTPERGAIDPERLGVFIGSESGRAAFESVVRMARAAGGEARFDEAAFAAGAPEVVGKLSPTRVSPETVTYDWVHRLGARGPVSNVALACSSSSAAVVEAVRAMQLGECDVALVGGVGADIDPFMLVGFGKLGALSTQGRSRPFDRERDGFVVGEGAAFMVLVAGDSGQRHLGVEVAGTGRSVDAAHLTAPHPQGRGAEAAMRGALAGAGVSDVDWVCAHGTSTPLNDPTEAQAIARVLGRDNVRISSLKGAVGHWIAGAGALSLVSAVHALRTGEVPPTCGLDAPDDDCPGTHIRGAGQAHDVRTVLVNAFAFGGANSSIVLRRAS